MSTISKYDKAKDYRRVHPSLYIGDNVFMLSTSERYLATTKGWRKINNANVK